MYFMIVAFPVSLLVFLPMLVSSMYQYLVPSMSLPCFVFQCRMRRYFVLLMFVLLVMMLCLRLVYTDVWPRGYKTFFMLNSAEHEI